MKDVYICTPAHQKTVLCERSTVYKNTRRNLHTLQSTATKHAYLESFSFVSCTSILSITGGLAVSSPDTRLNWLWTLINPRSTTTALVETEDCGMTRTGAFKSILTDTRKLLWARSFTLVAAFSAAWAVAALSASLATWKLFRKLCEQNIKGVQKQGHL